MYPAPMVRSVPGEWWARRRLKYNLGLVLAGGVAFLCYAWVFELKVAPRCAIEGRTDCEITLFTIFLGGCGYLVAMGIANVCYSIGVPAEQLLRPADPVRFR